jgi:hypothetical protein
MAKDLTTSEIDRQNILNNPYALAEIEKAAGIRGLPFEGKPVVLKEQVAKALAWRYKHCDKKGELTQVERASKANGKDF